MQSRYIWNLVTFAALGLACCASTACAQDADLIEMIVGLLKDSDKDMRAMAFDEIRTAAKTESATRQFASQLTGLPAESQVRLLSALADRGDVAAKPAVIGMLQSNEEAVRIAAIRALSKLGDTSDCEQLVAFLDKPEAIKQAAITSLVQIQGDGITKEIVANVNSKQPSVQVALIEILATRRALDTIPDLLQMSVGSNNTVRTAAMSALGKLAGPEHISGLVRGVLTAERGSERSNAERSLTLVCNRIEDKAQRAEPLLAVVKDLSLEEQNTMLVSLGRVGGPAALARIEKALTSKDGAVHSRGLSAIANWPNSSVADRLTELAYNDPHLNHQLTALRALIRVAPLKDGRSEKEKLTLLQKAMDMSHRYVDRNYALQRASAIRSPETLRWVLPFVDDPKYADQACKTIVELAHIRDLRDDNKEQFHAALDKVMATSKDPIVLDRASRYKKGQTWVRSN